ncbi:trichodiene oxygenase [Xylaria venustula]|nr:trichodiene oxygenase [Xylaria venustula]
MVFNSIPLSWSRITGTVFLYLLSLVVHRLFWHPLARFPGPKLAAVKRYVEAHYDLVCNGQYTFKISEMHKKYGPIIRISPHELHISDASFFEKLFSRDSHWDKYTWSYDAFGADLSTICAPDHYVHRRRRAPLSTFLSKLCHRLDDFTESNRSTDSARLKLGTAISAFTRDVATEYLFGHIRCYGWVMKSLPLSLVERLSDENGKAFLDMFCLTTDIHSASANKTQGTDSPHTTRCFDEVITGSGAAFETTAHSIRHIPGNLRNELATAKAKTFTQSLRLADLEQLLYLTAVMMKGLRLAPAVANRQALVAPDRDLFYKPWTIPAETPVGMTTILMHRDPILYPNPEQFNPERWMDIDGRRKAEKLCAPFSKGTRTCVGMQALYGRYCFIPRYDLSFDDETYEDTMWTSDQFIIGTSGKGGLSTTVKKVDV